jgi:hypothetical protein
MVIGFVVLLPIIIPIAIILNELRGRRLRKTARTFVCVRCGRVLGTEALARAREVESEHSRELMRRYPNKIFRIAPLVDAVCLGCNTWYRFRDRERTFVVKEPLASPGSSGFAARAAAD